MSWRRLKKMYVKRLHHLCRGMEKSGLGGRILTSEHMRVRTATLHVLWGGGWGLPPVPPPVPRVFILCTTCIRTALKSLFPECQIIQVFRVTKSCTFGFRHMPRSQFGTIMVCFPTRAEIPMVCFQGQGLIIIVSEHLAEKSGQWVLACISYEPQRTEQPPSGILPVTDPSGRIWSVRKKQCFTSRVLPTQTPATI